MSRSLHFLPSICHRIALPFHRRFLSLLSYQFRTFPAITSLSIRVSASNGGNLDVANISQPLSKPELDSIMSPYDLKRLEKYADQMVDYHLILDLIPTLATLYFMQRLSPEVSLSSVQQAILLAVGLQHKAVEDLEKELHIGVSQLLGIFIKIVRKITSHFRVLVEGKIAETLPAPIQASNGTHQSNGGAEDFERSKLNPLSQSLEEEFAEGQAIDKEEKERIRGMIDALPLDKYAVDNGGVDWEEAEQQVKQSKGTSQKGLTVSVKSKKSDPMKRKGDAVADAWKEMETSRHSKKVKGKRS